MSDLHKIATAYKVSVEWLRQETARGVDWSTAVDPVYRANRQAEIDKQEAEWQVFTRKSQAEAAARRSQRS